MVLGVVAGLKNGELVMAGVVGGDFRDKMAVQTFSILISHFVFRVLVQMLQLHCRA